MNSTESAAVRQSAANRSTALVQGTNTTTPVGGWMVSAAVRHIYRFAALPHSKNTCFYRFLAIFHALLADGNTESAAVRQSAAKGKPHSLPHSLPHSFGGAAWLS